MPARLRGKIALVTGGASGIGRAVCERFAAEGALVVIADLRADRCREVAEAIGASEVPPIPLALDVTDQSSIDHAVRTTIEAAGRIDILVNAAGIYSLGSIVEMTRASTARLFAVNVDGLIFMTQAVANHMIERQGGGRIINFSSQAGRRGEPPAVGYCATKAAVISITQSVSLDLVQHGINVNAIAPGVVDTPMWDEVDRLFAKRDGLAIGEKKRLTALQVPAKRFGRVEEQAAMAAFLASEDAAYIVGQCYNVDGGNVLS